MAHEHPVAFGLFDDSDWAHHALDGLKAVGFASDDMGLLEPRRHAPRRAAGVGAMADALVGNGMPEDLAWYYEEEVRRGSSLLAVRTHGDAALVETVLQRFGAYDVRPFDRERASIVRHSRGTPFLLI